MIVFNFLTKYHIADIRFNILNDYVDYFVIVEKTVNHQGEPKKLKLSFILTKISR